MLTRRRTPGSVLSGPGIHHFLTVASLDPGGLRALLDLAHRAKREPWAFRGALAGGKVGLIFDRPSTRSRVSLESAIWELGMLPVELRTDELQLSRGETIADTATAFGRYLDALVVRTDSHERLDEIAASSTIPVVNALTVRHHPCQALADLMTLEESFGGLAGLTVAYLGDGDNVCHSLIEGAALGGFRLRVACPPGYEPDPSIVAEARRIGVTTGGAIDQVSDPRVAAAGVDAVYTDVWASMAIDGEHDLRVAAFEPYRVDDELMALAAPRAVFLHCLPARRGEEVVDAVIDGRASRVWDQAENQLHVGLALLYALVAGDLRGTRLRGDGGPIVGWGPGPYRRP